MVYSFDLKSRSAVRLPQAKPPLSNPLGLAHDPGANLLYVADEDRDCVWVLDLTAPGAAWKVFLNLKALQQWRPKAGDPVSLAVDSKGVLWIGDTSAQAVFAVDTHTNKLLRILP